VLDLEPDEVGEVRVTRAALDSFRFHHGGTESSARRAACVDARGVALRSARQRTPKGLWHLAHSGYTLVLDGDLTTLIGYRTAHRERTWAQVRAGIRSRYRGSWKEASLTFVGPRPLLGLEVARSPLAEVAGNVWPNEDRPRPIRRCCRRSGSVRDRGPGGEIEPVEARDGGTLHRVRHDGRSWLLSADGRVLITVAPDLALDGSDGSTG
jgi:hypothetical protein